MKITSLLLACSLTSSALCGIDPDAIDHEVGRYCRDLPFTMPEVRAPRFADRVLSITDHGAVPDGRTLNTAAFAAAIEACAKSGGGTVNVPPGTWLTGPIRLLGGVNLHLDRGALVQFSSRIEDFPLMPKMGAKSNQLVVTPPLWAYQAENIAVTGEGIFDGAGEVWRYVKKYKLTPDQWKELTASGGVVSADGKEWWPSREAMEGAAHLKQIQESGKRTTQADYAGLREFIRPDMVQLVQCRTILLDGVTFQNSPRFHVRPQQSENIIVRNISIRCPWYAQNGDGLDLSSCRNVVIYKATVDVGDDGLCLKPSSIGANQKPGPSCENIVIADCSVYHAHGGFVIGSESFGGVNNISVRNCIFDGTDVGLRFKSYRGNGGLVRNVWIDGIQMRKIATQAILFDMYYAGNSPDLESRKELASGKAEPVTDRTPRFQDFNISNVVCNGAEQAMLVNGLPEMPVRNIRLQHVSIASVRGAALVSAEGITFSACRIAPSEGPVLTTVQSRNITIEGGDFPTGAPLLKVDGELSGQILLKGVARARTAGAVELGEGARADAVQQE